MTDLLLLLLLAECAALLAWGLVRSDRLLQYPFLAAAVTLGWVFPQLMGLSSTSALPSGALDKTLLMIILCLGVILPGYTLNRRPIRHFQWSFDRQRLVQAATMLTLIGAFFYYNVEQFAVEAISTQGGAWSGIITVFVFLSKLLTLGLIVALCSHLSRPSWVTFTLIGISTLIYLERIIIRGRRSAMAELLMIFLLALWFRRRRLPSRISMLLAVVLGALLINSIGDYRSTMLGEDRFHWSGAGISDIAKIDFIDNMQRLASGQQVYELSNAAMDIYATDRLTDLDFGLSLWNAFVQAFVPAQFLGKSTKAFLQFSLPDPAYQQFGYVPHFGSTQTGFSDSFRSFWFFGALKFFVIALILGRWWRSANSGNLVAQMVIMYCASPSLEAFTHSTHHFFLTFVELSALLLPALLYARVRTPSSATRSVSEKVPVQL
jgi:hypothetical protein